MSVLDDAYARLAPYDFVFAGGFSDHGPMVVEALTQLGREHEVEAWLQQHIRHLDPQRPRVAAIENGTWHGVLGNEDRASDWSDLFVRELDELSCSEVIGRWVPRLAPGVFAAATHGLLRTAHAVRAVAESDSPVRRHELAKGLGYWAATYQELGNPHLRGTLSVAEVLPALHPLATGARTGFITAAVAQHVVAEPRLAAVLDTLREPSDIDGAIDDLTAAFADVYLANARTFPIVFVHTVTAPAAARILLPFLDAEHQRQLFAYLWQAVAAIVSTYGIDPTPRESQLTDELGDIEAIDIEAIISAAVESGDEHAIKMCEACLREYRRSNDRIFLAAASDAAGRL